MSTSHRPSLCCVFAVVGLLGCGSTVVVSNPAVDAETPPPDRGSVPMDVGDLPSDAAITCLLSNGVRCPAGQSCYDGCNTCFCPADGGLPGCTLRACVDAGPPASCRSSADCNEGQECTVSQPGCAMTGVCTPRSSCARVVSYCGCDGVTFLGCAGAPHQPWARASSCADGGSPFDVAVCAGATISRSGTYCAGPADEVLPMDCCTGWDCNPVGVMCNVAPPPCPAGQVRLVGLGCWGVCVTSDRCRPFPCTGGRCPDGFACTASGTCAAVRREP